MSLGDFQLLSTVALLGVALWLTSRTLPLRDESPVRLGVVLALTVAATAILRVAGFSLYPTLTDDNSFVLAILSFLVVLGLLTAAQHALWEGPLLTALYCSSSAYLLNNLSDGLDRIMHLMGLLPPLVASTTGDIVVPWTDVLATAISATATFLLAYLLMLRRIERSALLNVRGTGTLFAVVLAISVSTVFDLTIKDVGTYEVPARYHLLLSFVHLATCAFILFAEYQIIYNRVLQGDLSTMERAIAEQERQFELSRTTIDAINRRCHDIRHQVANTLADASADGVITREELAQVVRDIDVYESSLRTGNAALDVVLTEKGLLARKEGVVLGVIADGHALDFLPASDIYALFSAALEGAIRAVCDVTETERRSIALNVRQRMGMVSISLEHYLPEDRSQADEGYQAGELALQTLREVVERHDGTISHNDDGSNIMHLNLLIPQA